MPIQSKFGYTIPDFENDSTATVCKLWDDFFERIICHDHDGEDSQELDLSTIKQKATIDFGDYEFNTTTCEYCTLVTVPEGVDLTCAIIQAKITGTNCLIHPCIEVANNNQIKVCTSERLPLTITFI